MRAIYFVLLGWAALGGAGLAQEVGNAASTVSGKTDLAPIHFDLATPKPAAPQSLPTAATLGELTYAADNQPEAKPAVTAVPKTAPRVVPQPAPRPAPRPAHKVVMAKSAQGPWMSEWRRAYIARHGHQPPVPTR